MGRKLGRGLRPLFGEGAGSPSNTKSLGPNPSSIIKWYFDPCSHLAAIDMGRKLGAPLPFWGSPSNTKSPGLRPTSIQSGILMHPAVWPQQIWAENCGDCAPLGRGAGSPSNTMWPGPRPTCVRSFILIRPTVRPQYTNVADRKGQKGQTDRQTDRTTVR